MVENGVTYQTPVTPGSRLLQNMGRFLSQSAPRVLRLATDTEADTQEDLCLSVPNSPPGKGHTEGVCPDACLSQRFPKPGLEEGFYRSCRRILCPVSLGNTIYYILWGRWASLVVQMVMNLRAMQETRV